MFRLLLLIAIVFAACGDDSSRRLGDAQVHDAPPDTAAGSNSLTMLEPHPHDSKLDILVAGLSLGVIVGPAFGARRRRRRDAI
ncbi:MAG: hypothetical protein ABI678_22580 [Kofleriaceae bacterium]